MLRSNLVSQHDFEAYLAGERLYGDDWSVEEIQQWFEDERHGYANLGARHRERYRYGYHALNRRYGFRYLPDRRFHHALAFGAAYGDELEPIRHRIDRITIVEPAGVFLHAPVGGPPTTYLTAAADGRLPLRDNSVDLITCLSVLHHIPNVSAVVRELCRVLEPGAYALLREPTMSMGDWRLPRKGLTNRERGIPLRLYREIITLAGFRIVRETRCMFPLTRRLQRLMGTPVYNSELAIVLDSVLCLLFRWNQRYHVRRYIDRFQPSAACHVLRKPPVST